MKMKLQIKTENVPSGTNYVIHSEKELKKGLLVKINRIPTTVRGHGH